VGLGQFWNGDITNAYLGDFNGDGRTDILRQEKGSNAADAFSMIQVYVPSDSTPDLLTTLTTPLGIQVKDITYKPLTDASVYTRENTAAYPLLDLQAPIYVVASYATNNGISGFNTTTHTYAGAKVHQTGRGYLGFRAVTETTPNGIMSTTTYRQDYPYVGLPAQMDVQQPNGGLLSRTLTTWGAYSYGGGRYFPYALSTTASSYELNGALITSATTVNDTLDSYGNIGRTTVTHSDNHKKTVLTYYDNDTANWRLGRPTSIQVTSTLPNGQSQTRTSSFSYHATTGLLIKDIIEPGTALALTTDSAYDAYGHKASITVSGSGIVTRTSTFAYLTSPGEAFAQTRSTNALGHSETQVLDARFGVPVSLTGPNGLTTTWAYDGFGRKLQETRADGTSSSWNYSACGTGCYKITAVATGSPTSSVYYNSLGRESLRETQGFDGQYVYVGTQYDTLGRVATTSRPNAIPYQYKTSYSYDLLGRVVSELKPTNLATRYTYQGLSTTVMVSGVLPGGSQSTTQIKNSQGQLVQAIDAAGNSTTYGYDPFGNLVKVVDAKSNILTMGYDLRGRKTSMIDPDMGSWIYQYNVLGELTYQLDAKNQAVTMQYDVLGRLIKRTEPEGISQWSYDTVANGKGKPATVTGPGGYARSYVYDGLGRPVRVSTTINATTYLMDTGYDAVGRVASTAYPVANGTRFTVYTQYNATGYLAAVTNSAGFVYWKANARDAEGHLLQETLGNGLVTTRSYNVASGALQTIRTGATNNVQNLNYAFDYLGNLQSRNDAIQNTTETFGYDALNRLTSVSGPAPKTYAYDSIGNLTSKSDVGTYSYGAKPHAVTATTGAVNATYVYDANGNLQSGNNRELAYTSFNLPSRITQGSVTTTFTYDADRARTVQTTASETTVYLNPRWDLGGHYEKTTKSSGVVEHKHYLYGSSGPVAIYTLKSDGASTTRYLHKDHLGSVDTVTSETGAVLERYSYDAFGKRRLPNGTDGAVVPATTHHGYTGHEHLDEVGLIHMNGRVYDPALGRFTQADPYIQDPTNSQSLNRYSYVENNPLKYTDPSGYKPFWKQKWFKQTVKAVVAVAAAAYTGGLATSAYFSSAIAGTATVATTSLSAAVAAASAQAIIVGGIVSGAMAGGIMGNGSLKSIVGGAATGMLFGAVGASGISGFSKVLTSGVVGGITTEMQGGKFEDGFKLSSLQSLANEGYQKLESLTDGYATKAGTSSMRDPVSGQRRTDGIIDCLGECGSLVEFGAMGRQGTLNHWYDARGFGVVRTFVNAVSKVHDVFNAWGYGRAIALKTS
jgi:RHS repeat-associated protein